MMEPLNAVAEDTDLEAWLAGIGRPLRDLERLPGDVSPRRYARLSFEDGTTAILATYPPEVRATCPRFLRTTELLTGAGVRVPRVLGSACDSGWMLLEDLGPETLGDYRDRPWSELAPWFESAMEAAAAIARLPVEALDGLNPTLGRELMEKELAQTWNLFLEPRGLTGGPDLARALRATLDELCASLAADPPVPCHRDFMARNLMPLPGGAVAVLDHQDLRLGPRPTTWPRCSTTRSSRRRRPRRRCSRPWPRAPRTASAITAPPPSAPSRRWGRTRPSLCAARTATCR